MPRPGMFPPTLKGKAEGVNVLPWSVEIKMCPLLGSQLFVYMPVAYNATNELRTIQKLDVERRSPNIDGLDR